MDLSQIINELGEDRESYFGAVAPPIIQTSNFAFKNVAQLREAMQDEFAVDLYSRGNNPTVTILRKKLQHWIMLKMHLCFPVVWQLFFWLYLPM